MWGVIIFVGGGKKRELEIKQSFVVKMVYYYGPRRMTRGTFLGTIKRGLFWRKGRRGVPLQ